MNEPIPTEFNEIDYLGANPDVATAVAAGEIPSGLVHYLRFGKDENRALKPGARSQPLKRPPAKDAGPHYRRDYILAGLDLLDMQGVEIGALTTPLVTKAEGNIFYVDHADAETLKKSYSPHPDVDIDKIIDVDGIWGENTLQEALGSDRKVDYVLASHVIEHTPDVITWLQEIRAILRPGGTLRLAIPDKRYTFDIVRFETRMHDVIDAWMRKARTPLPRLILEHHSLARPVDADAIWKGKLDPGDIQPYATLQDAINIARDAFDNGNYHDVHCWVFSPSSFADVMIELAKLDLLDFGCDYFIDTSRGSNEFFVAMIANDDKTERVLSWIRMKSELLPPHRNKKLARFI